MVRVPRPSPAGNGRLRDSRALPISHGGAAPRGEPARTRRNDRSCQRTSVNPAPRAPPERGAFRPEIVRVAMPAPGSGGALASPYREQHRCCASRPYPATTSPLSSSSRGSIDAATSARAPSARMITPNHPCTSWPGGRPVVRVSWRNASHGVVDPQARILETPRTRKPTDAAPNVAGRRRSGRAGWPAGPIATTIRQVVSSSSGVARAVQLRADRAPVESTTAGGRSAR